ncbi:UDP-glycosyltransferase 73C3-like [Prunus yedoensis var. nudiflora]|uniref:UDP-glycosyltransferase 73C3-like n=1 Tax=Prunus yedoensis var. nudiflora TaxID=2094558 RepID=A0A314ZM43_PRUYE|nr:UDP-glycosyltransferase 73C3-like [Prunus yedoensis var. nudiflora]
MNPGSEDFTRLHDKVKQSEEGAYGIVVNSFEELEFEYVKEYKKVNQGRVWSIGPVSLSNKTDLDKAQRGNVASIDENKCLNWLGSWPQSSVVYACLGSLSQVTTLQLVELGLGLEASNQPFVWVISRNKIDEWEKWLLEDGFEERIKGRGLLIHGWAPQFYNEKFIVQVLKIGVSVGAKVAIPPGEQEISKVLVKRVEFKEAIDKLWPRRLQKKGGSSYLNITLLIEDIRSCKANN